MAPRILLSRVSCRYLSRISVESLWKIGSPILLKEILVTSFCRTGKFEIHDVRLSGVGHYETLFGRFNQNHCYFRNPMHISLIYIFYTYLFLKNTFQLDRYIKEALCFASIFFQQRIIICTYKKVFYTNKSIWNKHWLFIDDYF